ncbi:MAG: hypothetical protein DI628_06200 [Blastochloris viridis]|uniref:Translocation and assembly module TamB C-terminal domain-containing protein n=1 Tax=Blastochloris viridis TaxID=1079 RepID=A0A6N4RB95_BLAVI|nr:MAG: hypothetical protein DI628_06200 [Blastochloris viridis]
MKVLLRVLLVIAALLLVVVLTLVGLWASGAVETLVNRMDVGVRLSGLRGNVVSTLHVDRVEVYDPEGTWLNVEQGDIVWRPLAYFTGTPLLQKVDVAKVDVLRQPRYPATEEEQPEEENGSTFDVLMLVPDSLQIGEVALAEPVMGRAQRVHANAARDGNGYRAEVATLDGPETTLQAFAEGILTENVSASVMLHEAPDGLLARLAGLAKGGISATVIGGMQGDVWRVDGLEATVGASRVNGAGMMWNAGQEVSGTAVLNLVRMQEWPVLAVQKLAGSVNGNVAVSGTLTALDILANVSSTDVGYDTVTAGPVAAHVNARVDTVSPTFAGLATVAGRLNKQFDIDVSATALGSVAEGQGRVSATVIQGKQRFAGSGAGWWRTDAAGVDTLSVRGPGVVVDGTGQIDLATLLAKAKLAVKIDDMRPLGQMAGVDLKGTADAGVVLDIRNEMQVGAADIKALQVDYAPYNVRLRNPTRISWDGAKGYVSPTVLEFAGGVVQVSGTMDAQRIAGGFDVQGLSLAALSADAVSGTLSGRGRITGPVTAPVVTLQASTGVMLSEYPLEATLRGDWRNGLLKADIEAQTKAQNQTFTARGNATVEGGLSVWPFTLGIGPESKIAGAFRGGLPLATLNPMLWEQGLQVGGTVSASVSLAGTVGEPQPRGRVELRGVEVSHADSGICLHDLRADVLGDMAGVRLSGLEAPDGQGGMLTAEGRVELQDAQALDMALNVRDFRLFCGGLASGKIDGGLTVRGTLPDHTVAGKLTVGPLQVQLPGNSREADIPYVEVIRVRPESEPSTVGTETRLNIEVDAPQRIYVRGRGLDAEFGGNIKVTGTAAQSLLNGKLTALRGSFTLIDRTLQLADSALRFEGAIPPSPFLDVKAKTTVRGTELTLAITGQAIEPKIVLTSDPYVPQDEALALLLFGRTLSNISAFEALKLAQAARILSGRDGGGPSLLDRARDTLGVDTLDVGSGEEGGVTVTTGKYLTDNVYLSVSQGAEPENREIKTEIELTPSINANTTVDGVGTQTFGVEWKRDY